MASPMSKSQSDVQALHKVLDAMMDALQTEHNQLLERDVDALDASLQRKSTVLSALARFPRHAFNDPSIADRLIQCRSLNSRNAALLSVKTRAIQALPGATTEPPQVYGRYGQPASGSGSRYSFGLV